MNYRYRAMTQDGQKLQGIIDANDERQARLRLREEGLFLLDIRPQKSSGVKTRRPRISHSELTLFTRQLATLSAAALPLEESLAVIGQQSSNNRLADVLNQVDAPRDKCTLSCAINGIHAAFHYLKKNYISGCVMTVPTG